MRGSRETADPEGGSHPLHTAALLCAIAAPLVLASALEIDPARAPRRIEPRAAVERESEPYAEAPLERALATPPPVASTAPSEPRPSDAEPAPPRGPEPQPLATRADVDARRLRDGGVFTRQFAVLCRNDSVRQLLAGLAADPALYVLPATVDGRPCYRLCYGSYASESAARAASPVPESLRRLTAQPRVVRIAEVAP